MQARALIAALALVLAGCGGGGGSGDLPAVNMVPTISAVADVLVEGNGTASTMVTVGDDQTGADNLVITVSSDAPVLLPEAGIVVATAGANRAIDLQPAIDEVGTATVTLTVTDANGLRASTQFAVTVAARDTALASLARMLFAAPRDAEPVGLNALNVIDDAQFDDFNDLLEP
jgi:hypothetical protein